MITYQIWSLLPGFCYCLTYDQMNQCVRVTYPIGDMSRLKNNQFQVVSLAARYEKRLIKIGKMENCNGDAGGLEGCHQAACGARRGGV